MEKILIIEDELSIAELQRDYLELNGFEVVIETDGYRGLQVALHETFDLMLPQMDGFEICRQVREVKDISILFVTAKREEIDKIRGLGLGADDFITKPFSPNELVARVRAHLSRYARLSHKEQRDKSITIRELTINPVSHRVKLGGKEVILTNKEFDLLYFLASHPNQVFNKDHLFEKIWGMDSNGDVATVVVHIRKLREKIQSATPFIETIWGAGYRFNL
ncbi:response regulator transcription factor [Shimazuella kribbensis]|uniref:response regulator transcription factor n=1 Tax=Shimazuella kribbensis TaxID=139808 RepID=UPI000415BA04|nr:response regulator transcription factor [Shimazuella kribbensis]